MSEELETDSNTFTVLDSSVKNTVIDVCENENDANSSKTSETAKRGAAHGTDLQQQTLPMTTDANGGPMAADSEHVQSDNSSDNFNTKHSSVCKAGESIVVDHPSSPLVDYMSSCSQLLDLRQCAIDLSTAASSLQRGDHDNMNKDLLSSSVPSSEQCNSDVSQLQASVSTVHEQRHTSGGCVKSGTVIQSTDHHQDATESNRADRPSTVVIISARRNKDSSTSCQADLNCVSSDVYEDAVDSVSQSTADLYMCCSDDDTTASATEFASDTQSCKHGENANPPYAGSQNESERISDEVSTAKHVVVEKQQMTASGMTFQPWSCDVFVCCRPIYFKLLL